MLERDGELVCLLPLHICKRRAGRAGLYKDDVQCHVGGTDCRNNGRGGNVPLTPFQAKLARDTECGPEFREWCINPTTLDAGHTGPKMFTYYTKDNKLHVIRVGQNRILKEIR